MSTETFPILYSFRRCPYAMRARLAIASSGFKVRLREVVLRDKPPEMIEISPKATVPVLVLDDGTVIDESLDIALHVLVKSDPEHLLMPEGAMLTDIMDLISDNDGPFKTSLDHYKYPNRYEDVDAGEARDNASEYLHRLDERLRDNNGYLFGARISFADIAIFPFVRQFANVDIDWFKAQDWADLIIALENFTTSDSFLSIMQKYEKWTPGSDVVIFGD